MTAIKESTIIGSEAVGFDVLDLLHGVIHGSNREGFEFHHFDVVRSVSVGLDDIFDASLTEDVLSKLDWACVNCIEAAIAATVAAVLNKVLNLVAEGVEVLSGPVGFNVGLGPALLADDQFVLCSPVPAVGIAFEALGRIDFELNSSASCSLGKGHVSPVNVLGFNSRGDDCCDGCEGRQCESFKVVHGLFVLFVLGVSPSSIFIV